jgi:hypothetical protein
MSAVMTGTGHVHVDISSGCGWALQSGSAGLGFQKGNLWSRFPVALLPLKVADPRTTLGFDRIEND